MFVQLMLTSDFSPGILPTKKTVRKDKSWKAIIVELLCVRVGEK